MPSAPSSSWQRPGWADPTPAGPCRKTTHAQVGRGLLGMPRLSWGSSRRGYCPGAVPRVCWCKHLGLGAPQTKQQLPAAAAPAVLRSAVCRPHTAALRPAPASTRARPAAGGWRSAGSLRPYARSIARRGQGASDANCTHSHTSRPAPCRPAAAVGNASASVVASQGTADAVEQAFIECNQLDPSKSCDAIAELKAEVGASLLCLFWCKVDHAATAGGQHGCPVKPPHAAHAHSPKQGVQFAGCGQGRGKGSHICLWRSQGRRWVRWYRPACGSRRLEGAPQLGCACRRVQLQGAW